MKARWCLVVALTASVGALGATSVHWTRTASSISAEPLPAVVDAKDGPEMRVRPEAQAGLAAPLPPLVSAPIPHRRDRTTLELDYVEPWTGEDLAPMVVASRRPQHGMDRADPWDPNITHPVGTPRDDRLDIQDPWGGIASRTQSPSMRKAKASLDKASPWDEAQASTTTTLGRDTTL